MCVAAIGLEDVAALQLAQPSLGKMAVKEPAQPFWCHIPRLANSAWQLWPIPTAVPVGAVVEQRLAAFAGNAAPRHTDSLLPEPVN